MNLISIILTIITPIVTFISFLIYNSYRAGKLHEQIVFKEELDEKLKDHSKVNDNSFEDLSKCNEESIRELKKELEFVRNDYNEKFNKIDTKIELKFTSIETNLSSIKETLAKRDAKEEEREKFEKLLKEAETQSLKRIGDLLETYNKKQDEFMDKLTRHDEFINNLKNK
jgi:hypothetical protein